MFYCNAQHSSHAVLSISYNAEGYNNLQPSQNANTGYDINEYTGFTDITRIVVTPYPFYAILSLTQPGGTNDNNARRLTAYLRGSSKQAQSYDQDGKKVYLTGRLTRGQGRRALEGQTECIRPISHQKQHRRQKITGLSQCRFTVVRSLSLEADQAVDSERKSYYRYAHFTEPEIPKSRVFFLEMGCGGGWRVFIV